MIIYKDITNYSELYAFHMNIKAPYINEIEYGDYLKSLFYDTDSYGNKLFKEIYLIGAYSNEELVGFIQFGITNFGFDDNGEISEKINYSVIRNLYFEDDDVGEELLKRALILLKKEIYAFFHYFGMSCFSRHGKLYEKHKNVEDLLIKNKFSPNEINVYYSITLERKNEKEINIATKEINEWNTQNVVFKINNEFVGEAEIHFVNKEKVYLRWIYVIDEKKHLGYGTRCMNKLNDYLFDLGVVKLDTDTALDNLIAQRYYERNNFINLGKTKSYIKE